MGHLIFNKKYEATNLINCDISGSAGIYFIEINTKEDKHAV